MIKNRRPAPAIPAPSHEVHIRLALEVVVTAGPFWVSGRPHDRDGDRQQSEPISTTNPHRRHHNSRFVDGRVQENHHADDERGSVSGHNAHPLPLCENVEDDRIAQLMGG